MNPSSSGSPSVLHQASTEAVTSARPVWIAGSAVALFAVFALAAIWAVSRELAAARASHADVEQTWEVIEQLQLVLSALQDAETGERGYVITGNASFLDPYYEAERSLEEHLARLNQLLPQAASKPALEQLTSSARRQLALLRRVIELRDQVGEAAAAAFIRSGEGKQHMDAIRVQVRTMRAREQQQLTQRLAIYEQRSLRTEAIVHGTLALAALLTLVVGAFLMRHVRRRIRAEEAARAAILHLRSIMENLTQGVAVFNPALDLIAWNANYLEMRGLDPARVFLGMPVRQLKDLGAVLTMTTPSGLRDTRSSMPTRVEREHGFDAEAHRADGMTYRVRGRPMPDGNYIITYTDITQLKVSEAAYRDQAARLASTLDNVMDAIVTINESGSIESWSQGAQRLFGYEAEEVLRRNVRMLMPEPHASAHDGYIRHYLQTGERRIIGMRREVEALHKDGHRVPVDLGISEMRIGSRRLFIGVVRDISARLEVERLKSGFVSTVSHELRTPLTSISGSLGLLAGGVAGNLPPKAARLIEIAKLNSERLVRLINDILDVEKAESGKLDFHLEAVRLKPIVQQAIDLNRAYAQSFGVAIELEARSTDALVLVDRDRLIQVLTNLLSNAAKFSPHGGMVHVAIDLEHDNARVSVRDEGPGIAPEFQPRIFQKFAQADSSDSRAKGGTGLGLSIAKTIMERLGGGIGFASEAGQGATFYVTLPVRHEARTQSSAAQISGAPLVLVCEDDPDIAEVLVEILRKVGVRTEAVSTAQAARALLETMRFDLAIVDLNLPDADGLELITELRGRDATRSLPVIVVTARLHSANESELISTLQLGDWLQKPVDPRRLLEAIKNALSQSRHERACILHVEDDESLTQLVYELLEGEADVVVAHSLAAARERINGRRFDLVILDVRLGDGSGLDVLPLLRRNGRSPPVILYSATEPSREVCGMVQAALVKSRDSIEQLLATIRELTSRSEAAGDAAIGTRQIQDRHT